jgi:hypothetical protein
MHSLTFWLIRGKKLAVNIPLEILTGADCGWMSSAAACFEIYSDMCQFALA